MTTANPLEQFDVRNLLPIEFLNHNFGFTNSAMFMLIAVVLVSVFFLLALRKTTLVPAKLQSSAEILHNFTLDILNQNTMGKGEKFFPFIFSLFCFILTLNLLGMMPYGFTVTSHISITFALAMLVFLGVTIAGIVLHGFGFFSLFLPKDIPVVLAPLMVIIELFVYLTRPLSLSIRLAANMIAGHILLYIVAGFIAMMGIWGVLPISFVVVFIAFEIFVAILQAYIFTILTCVYLNDAINLH